VHGCVVLKIVSELYSVCSVTGNCVLVAGQQHLAGKPPAPPLFVTVPPRTQKVVHSETYLRCVIACVLSMYVCGGTELGHWPLLVKTVPDILQASVATVARWHSG